MKEHVEDPPRWRENRDQNTLAERTIGQDLRAIRTPAPLSDTQMARLGAALRPTRPRYPQRRLVLAAFLILGLASAASAARLDLLPRWLTGARAPVSVESPEPRTGQRKSMPGRGAKRDPALASPPRQPAPEMPPVPLPAEATPLPSVPALPPAPIKATPSPTPGSLSASSPRATAHRRDTGGPIPDPARPTQPLFALRHEPLSPPATFSPPPPAPMNRPPQVAMIEPPRPLPATPIQESPKPGGDSEAAKVLADAIRLVRTDHQPGLALALLDRQNTRLDASPYRHEALLVRVECLLALKREADLLRLLDGTPLDDVAASRTLLSTRGRLRAAARRCAEALADFDRVLAEPGRKDKQALLGRARCREALGDAPGAQADRERYRQEAQAVP